MINSISRIIFQGTIAIKSGVLLLVLAILNLFPSKMLAQDESATLKNEEINVIKEYKPILADAIKVLFSPKFNPQEVKGPVMKYDIPQRLLNLPPSTIKFRPLAMKRDKLNKLYNVFLKGGYGNLATPLLEVSYNSSRSKKFNYGASYDHLSSQGKESNQNFSDNNASVFGKYFFRRVAISNEIDFSRNVVHYYGYDVDTFSSSDVQQRYQNLSYATHVYGLGKNKAKIGYDIGLRLDYFIDNTSKESNVHFSSITTKKLKSGEMFGVDLTADIISLDQGSLANKLDRTIINFKGYLNLGKNKFKAVIGMHPVMEFVNDSSKLHVFIIAKASTQLVQNRIVLNGGFNGSLQNNSLQSISTENPYISNYLEVRSTKITGGHAGIKGSIGHSFSYDTKFSLKSIQDLPLYVNDTADMKQFMLIYEKKAVVFNLHGEISIQRSEKSRFLLSGDYFNYDLENYKYAYHLPEYEANLYFFYSVGDKVLFTSNLFMLGGMFANDSEKLKEIIDINFSLQYKYSKNIALFCNLNNISSLEHQRWKKYPSYGFNFLGGLAFSF